MCLGEVAEVTRVTDKQTALVRVGQREVGVSLLTLDEGVEPGDWVLVHAGFALSRLTAAEASDALDIRTSTWEDQP